MSFTVQIVFGVVLLVMAVFLVIAVLLQEGKSYGLSGAIAGGADTMFGKTRGKKVSDMLSKVTTIIAIIFALLVIVLTIANRTYIAPFTEDVDKVIETTESTASTTENGDATTSTAENGDATTSTAENGDATASPTENGDATASTAENETAADPNTPATGEVVSNEAEGA